MERCQGSISGSALCTTRDTSLHRVPRSSGSRAPYLTRQHPDRRFVTISPGNTTGTQAPNDLALPLRLAAKYVMPTLGTAHKLDVGAKRLVNGVTDPTLRSPLSRDGSLSRWERATSTS